MVLAISASPPRTSIVPRVLRIGGGGTTGADFFSEDVGDEDDGSGSVATAPSDMVLGKRSAQIRRSQRAFESMTRTTSTALARTTPRRGSFHGSPSRDGRVFSQVRSSVCITRNQKKRANRT